ncbi:hypothetical protein VKT23_019505 [Stygiomarasmius scandens]|uniref:Uncharacterized protein n=1 Tax=Marasmiellus scandens TaxID=2682957 RepID=A0ABR1IQC5_9AGAR
MLPSSPFRAARLLSTSTVHRGNIFEQRCQDILEKNLSMSLRRVGGRDDGGIDLIGWWWLPRSLFSQDTSPSSNGRARMRVVAQCKAEKKKPGPKYVRELEGVVYRYMANDAESASFSDSSSAQERSSEYSGVVGVFLSESPYTKSTLLRTMSSTVPLLLIHIPPLPTDSSYTESSPGSIVWNQALGGTNGLFKGQLDARWSWEIPESHEASPVGIPSLWLNGQRVWTSL